MSKKTSSFIVGAALGAAAGYATGILTAPKSGKETREDIKQFASDIYEDRSELIETLRARTLEKAEDFKEMTIHAAEEIQGKTIHAAEEIREMTASSVAQITRSDAPKTGMTSKTAQKAVENAYVPRPDYSEFVESFTSEEADSDKTVGALRTENEELKKLINEIKGS